MKIRVETIAYYLERASAGIIARKKRQIGSPGPLLRSEVATRQEPEVIGAPA